MGRILTRFYKARFQPTRLGGLALWLDAADANSITQSANAVSQWNDKSGKSNHVTQTTGLAQPIYTPNGQNSKSTIAFGASQYMIMPSGLYSTPAAANTIFSVSKRNTESAALAFILNFSNGAGSLQNYLSYDNATGNIDYCNNSSSTFIAQVQAAGFININYQIITATFDGANTQTITSNNAATFSNASASVATTIDRAWIGGKTSSAFFLNGGIAELIIYNRLLSSTEITKVKRYLANKWGLII